MNSINSLFCTAGSAIWFAPGGSDTPGFLPGAHSQTKQAADPVRILIVEDEILVAIDIRIMLEANGYVVIGMAASAEQAITIAGRERPDLVLMDVRLEGGRDGV